MAGTIVSSGLQLHADGDFMTRKRSAAQAYHEWMPIRETATNFYAINRTLQFGECKQPCSMPCNVVAVAMATDECKGPESWAG